MYMYICTYRHVHVYICVYMYVCIRVVQKQQKKIYKFQMLSPQALNYCISPNVGRYFGLVTGPPLPPAMEAAAAATERFRRERSRVANLTRINLIFNLRHRRSEVTVFTPFCLFVCLCVCLFVCL